MNTLEILDRLEALKQEIEKLQNEIREDRRASRKKRKVAKITFAMLQERMGKEGLRSTVGNGRKKGDRLFAVSAPYTTVQRLNLAKLRAYSSWNPERITEADLQRQDVVEAIEKLKNKIEHNLNGRWQYNVEDGTFIQC